MICDKCLVNSICTTACKKYIDDGVIGRIYTKEISKKLKNYIVTIQNDNDRIIGVMQKHGVIGVVKKHGMR